MNINTVVTMRYAIMDTWLFRKNKPNSKPIKPKTNPIKAKTNPIQTQSKPIALTPKFELLFHLTYESRLLNWIKCWQLLKSVQNCPYQYKKPAFIAERIPGLLDSFQKKEEILSCRLTVAHFSKAQ
ncbi:MAG: hypothetical protein FVQ84_19970 [Planctomycetes bacterium]|nr:hypothetical protein [Planctomycetota bacterium]